MLLLILQEIRVIRITKNNNHPVVCEYTGVDLIQGSAAVIHIAEQVLIGLVFLKFKYGNWSSEVGPCLLLLKLLQVVL